MIKDFENLTDEIKNKLISFKKEILSSDITTEEINNREQNFLYIGDKITDTLYNHFGAEYLYQNLLYKDYKTNYKELDDDEFNSIWWTLLDIVENYIQCVVEGEL